MNARPPAPKTVFEVLEKQLVFNCLHFKLLWAGCGNLLKSVELGGSWLYKIIYSFGVAYPISCEFDPALPQKAVRRPPQKSIGRRSQIRLPIRTRWPYSREAALIHPRQHRDLVVNVIVYADYLLPIVDAV